MQIFVPTYMYVGEWIRKHNDMWCIIQCTWLSLSELHYSQLLHIWNMLNLPWINLYTDFCFHIYRRTNKESQWYVVYSSVYVIILGGFIIATHLKHILSTISILVFVFHVCRKTMESQGYVVYSSVYVIESWWVSVFTIAINLYTGFYCHVCRRTNKESQW